MDDTTKMRIVFMAEQGVSLTKISEITDVEYASVYYHAAKSGLYKPKRNFRNSRPKDYSPQLGGYFLSVVEGTLLSDAGLFALTSNSNAIYSISLSGKEHDDWLNSIEEVLTSVGVSVLRSCKERENIRGSYMHNMLWTRVHPELTLLYEGWYANGVKEVPANFTLTPVSLAHWFMGDGCSSWCFDGLVSVYFSTQRFSRASTNHLKRELSKLGVMQVNDHKPSKGDVPGVELAITSADNITKLMSIVDPFILTSYRYKVKYPRRLKT